MEALMEMMGAVEFVEVPSDAYVAKLVRKSGKARAVVKQGESKVREFKGGTFSSLLSECADWTRVIAGVQGIVPKQVVDEGYVEYALVQGAWRKVVDTYGSGRMVAVHVFPEAVGS